jgi:lipopolysaccharide export system protein LptA
VRSRHLDYTEQNRLAHYTGDVVLSRPLLQVKAADLRAFLAESGSDSRLERAFADGKVDIFQNAPDRIRTRHGTAEHSEYYTDEGKVILRGGDPTLVEVSHGSPANVTKGSELTYFANDDRLLVNGAVGKPASSRIRRK